MIERTKCKLKPQASDYVERNLCNVKAFLNYKTIIGRELPALLSFATEKKKKNLRATRNKPLV